MKRVFRAVNAVPCLFSLFALAVVLCFANPARTEQPSSKPDRAEDPPALAWPKVSRPETKPWTWWWWHGSAVTKAGITANLEALQRSGIGGVNIVCLLDVRDDQAVKLRYLSKEWIEAVAYAVREARRLGMDADISPVPGWAFGGPWVTRDDACAVVEVKRLSFDECRKNGMRIASFGQGGPAGAERRDLSAVVAQSADGTLVDLSSQVDDESILHWTAPAGTWTLYTAMARTGSSRVRMPTYDGDGWVVDHLSVKAVKRYFEPYDKAFALVDGRDLPRAFNNDSWEIHLDWTRDFFDEFSKRRGYDLRQQLPAFIGEGNADTVARVTGDYRQTLSDLMVDNFTRTFSAWAASHERRIIGETIFEPANDLDTFALYDIPQADLGGPLDWYLQGGEIGSEMLDRGKMAVSPAHILGKALVSSETLTCFGPVLDTPMAAAKEKLDADLLMGINHTMLHGISYSPPEARWPGWLFYAGFHLGPMNPMWRQGPQMCSYITRCQSFLQSGRPNDDLLIYLPIHDLWAQRPKDKNGKEKNGPPGMIPTTIRTVPTAGELWRRGYDFSLVSDHLLESVGVENGIFKSPGGNYRALVVADCHLLPDTTLERMVQFAREGGTVILPGRAPADVPGLAHLDERRARFRATMRQIDDAAKPIADGMREARLSRGRIILGGTATAALAHAEIERETMFDGGLRCIRRLDDAGTTYFVVNPVGGKRVDGWVPLNAVGASVVLFDPMDGRRGLARHRPGPMGGTEVFLQLGPRESCILRVLKNPVAGPAWTYFDKAGEPIAVKGPWQVSFLEGGEAIPHPETVAALTSWTTWSGDQSAALKGFSGVACYVAHFPKPSVEADDWAIDLGEVLHTARVRLNGILLGDRFTTPMRVLAGTALKAGDNLLEIEVANTPMNRAADLDLKGIVWQKTLGRDARTYAIGDFGPLWKKKEAATWQPRPSGLLGPVQLIPLKKK